MKIVYISNFMNHHQLPVAQKLYEALGDDYKFIALQAISEERISLGYEDMNHKYPFVVCAYESKEQMKYAERLALECDVLIAGSCPDYFIKRRTNLGKIVIKTSERFFKKETCFKDKIHNYLSSVKHLAPFQNKKLYFLCASAYTALDVNRFTRFDNKTYKWGYFPEVKRYEDIEKIIELKNSASILWVGRLIEMKHPELPVMVAKRLKAEGCEFQMNLIGNGQLEEPVRKMIENNHLEDCVHLLGSMSPENVREYMEKSQIFLFTSDRQEGWGAVLNEAMNSGCACVANRAIGSVPFLLKDGKNGLIYDSEEELYQKTKVLLENESKRQNLGINAYKTIVDLWSPEVAAERLIDLADNILKKDDNNLFLNGPCSKV